VAAAEEVVATRVFKRSSTTNVNCNRNLVFGTYGATEKNHIRALVFICVIIDFITLTNLNITLISCIHLSLYVRSIMPSEHIHASAVFVAQKCGTKFHCNCLLKCVLLFNYNIRFKLKINNEI
jgi:hypothetical protein